MAWVLFVRSFNNFFIHTNLSVIAFLFFKNESHLACTLGYRSLV